MAQDDDTLPLECVDPDSKQSVPCPENLPGPTCDPDGQMPQIINDPEDSKPAPLVVNGEQGTLPPGLPCYGLKLGNKDTPGPLPGQTETGPGVQINVGECSGPGSLDLNGKVSTGKSTMKVGNVTDVTEGPNASGGFSLNPTGESRVGAQANIVSKTTQYDGKDGTIKGGMSIGVGLEGRMNEKGKCGVGMDIGPASFDVNANGSCRR